MTRIPVIKETVLTVDVDKTKAGEQLIFAKIDKLLNCELMNC